VVAIYNLKKFAGTHTCDAPLLGFIA
jgi:hypothetical protein